MENLPIVKSLEEEIHFRKNNRGKYHLKIKGFTDPDTGEVVEAVDQVRSTRLEYPSPIPVEIPIYLRKPESTDDRIRRLMEEQREWIAYQQREEESEFDENDFDEDSHDPDVPPTAFEFAASANANIRRNKRIRDYKEARAKKGQKEAPTEAQNPPATPPADTAGGSPQEAKPPKEAASPKGKATSEDK